MNIVSENEIAEAIDQAIANNRVMLFMKGTPDQPLWGFSLRRVGGVRVAGGVFGALNILPDPGIRQILSARSGWPTIPQLFVDGQLVGGCDIVMELHQSGELHDMVAAQGEDAATPASSTE
jgi:monothiol glutaredoxin